MELSVVISTNSRAKSLEILLVVIIGQDNDTEQIIFILMDRGYVDTTLRIVEACRNHLKIKY